MNMLGLKPQGRGSPGQQAAGPKKSGSSPLPLVLPSRHRGLTVKLLCLRGAQSAAHSWVCCGDGVPFFVDNARNVIFACAGRVHFSSSFRTAFARKHSSSAGAAQSSVCVLLILCSTAHATLRHSRRNTLSSTARTRQDKK